MRNNLRDIWILTKANFINTYELISPKKLITAEKGKLTKYIVIAFALIMVTLTMYNYYFDIATMIYNIEGEEGLNIIIYLSIISVFTSTVFLCLYRSTGYLFSFKDYDMITSLPVNTISILASRIILLYVSVLFINIIAGLPGILVFGYFVNSNFFYYLYMIFLFMLLPIVPLIIGCIGAFFITKISTKFNNTSFIITLGSILFIILITVLTMSLQNIILSENVYFFSRVIGIMKFYLPGVIFVKSFIEKSLFWFIISVITNITLLTIFTYFFSANFKRLNGILNETYKKSNYKLTELVVSSQLMALYKKELSKYLSSSTYILNTSIGMVFIIIFSLFAPFILDNNMDTNSLNNIIFGITSACVAIVCTTSVSISLEGKSFFLLKVLPIKFNIIALSKVLLNLTVTLPIIIISCIILSINMGIGLTGIIILVLSLCMLSVLISLNGLVINLFFPKLNFKSDIEVIKQSTSTIISLFINLLIFALINFINFTFSITAVVITTFILCSFYVLFIYKEGTNLFNEI